MSRIFISHSSRNNREAASLVQWLADQGWANDLFVDFDAARGIAAGARWERALYEAAHRCEAVLFLISKAWLASRACGKELSLAYKLNKRLFGVLIEDLPVSELPEELTESWQLVHLARGVDLKEISATLPITQERVSASFSLEGLMRLKRGLQISGLDPEYFLWPPEDDPDRAPYPGLAPFDAPDAGIFFGREGAIVDALDTIRGLRAAPAPRMLTVLGASGAGKSSFLRAGLIPRLRRQDYAFQVLPPIRPERAVMTGEHGFCASVGAALRPLGVGPDQVENAVRGGASAVQSLCASLSKAPTHDRSETAPTLIICVDQAEELFSIEGASEARQFLELMRGLLATNDSSFLLAVTIRSDSFDRLQQAESLVGIKQHTISLAPMPAGAFSEIIRGPARRYRETGRTLTVDDRLVDALLADLQADEAKDALPLLSFTLERLFVAGRTDGRLSLPDYDNIGRIRGSIDAAIEDILSSAQANLHGGRARHLDVLRAVFVPRLATIDFATGAAKRNVARLEEFSGEQRTLVELMISRRLLSVDQDSTGNSVVEATHEALLRQWGLLSIWLSEERDVLTWREETESAALKWEAARLRVDREETLATLHTGRALGLSPFWITSERSKLTQRAQKFVENAKSSGRLIFALGLYGIYPLLLQSLSLFFRELYEGSRPTPPLLLAPPAGEYAIYEPHDPFRSLVFGLLILIQLSMAARLLYLALAPHGALKAGAATFAATFVAALIGAYFFYA